MNRLITARPLLAAAIAFGTLAAASAAHAHTGVSLSIGLPGAYVQPQPVFVQPAQVFVPPEQVFVPTERVFVQPSRVFVQPQPVYVEGHRYGHHHHRRGAWGDADRDGVPNRFDHAPLNPHRR